MPIRKKEFELFKNVIERLNEQNQSYNNIGSMVIFVIAGAIW